MARSPVLQIPNTAQIKLAFSVANQLAVNILGASHTGTVVFNQALAEALGSAIKAAFTANLASRMTINTSLARVGIRSLSSPHLTEFRDTAAIVTGSAAGDSLPGSLAQCITLRTAQSGKSARGRMYLSGWAETENDVNGRQSTLSSTAGVAFLQAVQSAFTANGLALAVLSRPAYEQIVERTTTVPGSAPVVDRLSHSTAKPGSFLNVVSIESRSATWESQKRRVNGRGVPPTVADPVAIVRF